MEKLNTSSTLEDPSISATSDTISGTTSITATQISQEEQVYYKHLTLGIEEKLSI